MKLFYNSTFYSMKNPYDTYRAVLVEGERIKAVFRKEPDAGIEAEKVDMGGVYVLPGFIDAHTHSYTGGLYTLAVSLAGAKSLSDVFNLLACAEKIEDRIIAWQYDEANIKEGRFPLVSELDKLFPYTPVIIRRIDGHSCRINTAACKRINWSESFSLNENELLIGTLNDEAFNRAHHCSRDIVLKAYEAASNLAVAAGITTVHTAVSQVDNLFPFIREKIKSLSTEFILYPQVYDVQNVLKLGSPRIGGCLLVDGSIGSHTAALTEPYSDKPGWKGILYHPDCFWEDFFTRAYEAGLQVSVHAIGDAATGQIVRILEKLKKKSLKDLRPIIVHNELIQDEDIIKMIPFCAVMQPAFDRLWGGPEGTYAARLGKARALNCNRLATLLHHNIMVAGSSDWYITELNALKGIEAAVHMHNNNERLTPFEAVQLYTCNAAYVSFDEKRLGYILPGYQADMVCLDNDPFKAENLKEIKIKTVIKKGRLVLTRDGDRV